MTMALDDKQRAAAGAEPLGAVVKCGARSRSDGVAFAVGGLLLFGLLCVFGNSRGLFNFHLVVERVASLFDPSTRSFDLVVQGLGLAVALLAALAMLLAGLFAALGETTYFLTPELIRREIRCVFWSHVREFRPGRLLLRLTCEKLKAPEQTLWKWALEVQDVDGKRCCIIGNKTLRRFFSREECSADALKFAQASGWKLDEKIECAPQPSTTSV